MVALRTLLAAALLGSLAFAGCADDDDPPASLPGLDEPLPHVPVVNVTALVGLPNATMTFTNSIVLPAIGIAADLYEPTMEVSDTGTIYVAAHVIAAATTGTPAWYSNDDGATWEQLPFVGPVSSPLPTGSQPPPGDEGFIVAGDNGQAWMADIYAAGFSVSGWCNDGGELCYDNRQAYDRATATTGFCSDGIDPQFTTAASLNDRPWAAYGGGWMLLVNNPGGGPMQIGALQVPPPTPVGLFDPVTGPEWNLCATEDGSIPGIPDMRADGFFAVPQSRSGGDVSVLQVVTGNISNIFDVEVREPIRYTNTGSGTSNGGRIAFDLDGDLFVGIRNNTEQEKGGFIIAVSQDDGVSWANVTFRTDTPLQSLYLDSNMMGPGVLVTWSQVGGSQGTADWYVGHLFIGPNGEPVLENANLVVDDGPPYSAHVMGAAAGPDGRAYFVMFDEDPLPQYVGSTPISVWIQQDGPTLPLAEASESVA
jgi:hypothetical protein